MSYILGALKKADKERARDQSAELDNWNQDDWDEPKPEVLHKGLLMLVALLIFLLVVVVAVLTFQLVLTNRQSEEQEYQDVRPIPLAEEKNLTIFDNEVVIERVQEKSAQTVYIDGNSSNLGGAEGNLSDDQPGEASSEASELPDFTGHMFFPSNSALSRVFANSRSYREGEFIGRYKVESIEELKVVLSENSSDSGDEVTIEISLGQ